MHIIVFFYFFLKDVYRKKSSAPLTKKKDWPDRNKGCSQKGVCVDVIKISIEKESRVHN